MLSNLATFLHANGRRVLLVAVIGAAIAGAFGFGVAQSPSPYCVAGTSPPYGGRC